MGLGAWGSTHGDVMDRGLAMARDPPRSGQAHHMEGMNPTSGSWSPPTAPQPPAVPPSSLPVTCMGAGMGTSVPTGACAPGQAALATGTKRQTAAGGGGLAQPAGGQSKAPVLGVPPGEQQSLVFPMQGQGAPIYSSTFLPRRLPAHEKGRIVGDLAAEWRLSFTSRA